MANTKYIDITGITRFWNNLSDILDEKQDTLTAGTGITITGNTISASGGGATYTAGTGISIVNGVISVDLTNAENGEEF